MKGGGSFGKVLILSFRDDEEYIINRILSCMNRETEILHQGDVRNGQLHFEGLYIDEQKRIAVRENNEIELTYTEFKLFVMLLCHMRSSFSMFLLYHAYVYLEFLILAYTIYILAPSKTKRYSRIFRVWMCAECLSMVGWR